MPRNLFHNPYYSILPSYQPISKCLPSHCSHDHISPIYWLMLTKPLDSLLPLSFHNKYPSISPLVPWLESPCSYSSFLSGLPSTLNGCRKSLWFIDTAICFPRNPIPRAHPQNTLSFGAELCFASALWNTLGGNCWEATNAYWDQIW